MTDDIVLDEVVPDDVVYDEVVPDELVPGKLVAGEFVPNELVICARKDGKVVGDVADAGVNGDVNGDVKVGVADGKCVDCLLGRFFPTSTSVSSSEESLEAARFLIRIANRMFEDGSVETRSSSSSCSEPVSVSSLTERVKSGHRLPIV